MRDIGVQEEIEKIDVVVSGAGSIHINRLNSYNESLLVYFTGDEACILLHN